MANLNWSQEPTKPENVGGDKVPMNDSTHNGTDARGTHSVKAKKEDAWGWYGIGGKLGDQRKEKVNQPEDDY